MNAVIKPMSCVMLALTLVILSFSVALAQKQVYGEDAEEIIIIPVNEDKTPVIISANEDEALVIIPATTDTNPKEEQKIIATKKVETDPLEDQLVIAPRKVETDPWEDQLVIAPKKVEADPWEDPLIAPKKDPWEDEKLINPNKTDTDPWEDPLIAPNNDALEEQPVIATTSTQTGDRVVPQSRQAGNVAAITPPTTSLTVGFAVGPNPVARQAGAVNFFRSGSRIASSSLSVYDASGNMVKKLALRDNADGNSDKRAVGLWDLRDANGRSVPGGTYLVKGVVNAAGGKTERVSATVCVR